MKLETLLTVSVFVATSTASSASLISNGGFEQPLWVFQSGAGIVHLHPVSLDVEMPLTRAVTQPLSTALAQALLTMVQFPKPYRLSRVNSTK
jgi:hypothetical protein